MHFRICLVALLTLGRAFAVDMPAEVKSALDGAEACPDGKPPTIEMRQVNDTAAKTKENYWRRTCPAAAGEDKHQNFVDVYNNGALFRKGTMLNGKLDGKDVLERRKDGSMEFLTDYTKGLNDGKDRTYARVKKEDGSYERKLKWESDYIIDDKGKSVENGTRKQYNPPDTLQASCEIRKGKLEGLCTYFYPSGCPSSMGNFKDNKIDGKWQLFADCTPPLPVGSPTATYDCDGAKSFESCKKIFDLGVVPLPKIEEILDPKKWQQPKEGDDNGSDKLKALGVEAT